MNAAREELLERLFVDASALAPERRAAFLDGACAADPDLRYQLETLLTDAADAYWFVDQVMGPAVARFAGVALGDSRAEDAADTLTGHDIAHFRVLEKLGGGGMGLVYKAIDLKLDRTVALKFLPTHLGADNEAKQRFIQEAKAASALDHANICAIHEIGETDAGQLFIAMAYYDGETLQQKIKLGPLPVREAVGYFEQLAEGLRRAHDAGIVHRDIKPANVLITDQGRVKIVDFGVAKMRDTSLHDQGAAIGTVAYMSPEQSRGDAVDARSDIWSLGVVLYEMLTARRPFRGESDQAVTRAIRSEEPTSIRGSRPEITADLAALVTRCLQKNANGRYRDADELLAELRTVKQGRTPPPPTVRHKRSVLYGSAVLLCAVLGLLGTSLRGRYDAQSHEERRARSLQVKPEALALYLQASRLPDKVQYFLPRKALLEEAIAKDSTFAMAYAQVALSYIMNARDKPKAEWAIARAIALDPFNSEAYSALGLLRMWMDWDWPAAEAALRHSIDLNSNNSRAHHELGQLFMRVRRCDDAIAEERRAMSLDPRSAQYQAGIGEVYLNCRLYDEARRELEKGFDLGRDSSNIYWALAETYFHQGQFRTAITMYEKTPWPAGWAYVPLGSREEAIQQVAILRARWLRGETNGQDAWILARLYTSLGEPAEAITWLERMYERRDPMLVYLKVKPHLDPLRGEPRFQALLKKVGLGN